MSIGVRTLGVQCNPAQNYAPTKPTTTQHHALQKKNRSKGVISGTRGRICGARDVGMSVREIAKKFKVAKSTVQDTIKADQKGRPHQKSNLKPRGAHCKTTIAEDRRIVRAAVLTPEGWRQPLHDIHINIAPNVFPSTIRRRLREQRIRKW